MRSWSTSCASTRPRAPVPAWCHMATDGSWEELHAFAARLGLRRAWFQGDHYDLPPHGRAAAVALGAEEVGDGELLLRMAGRGGAGAAAGARARGRRVAAGRRRAGGAALPAGGARRVGGPPGAGKSTLAARAVGDGCPCSTPTRSGRATAAEWGDALRAWRARWRPRWRRSARWR